MSERWILDADGEPVQCESLLDWARWMQESPERRVVARETVNGAVVSTVFLGLDHQFGRGLPLLFETMVFGGPNDQNQERYSTRAEALAGHTRVVEEERSR
jgi:hypothetical protein